ncbi:nitroreductase family protein [Amycolatopsis jejuensis]|uniref:nitroreductase family protein n=1 Tax=Amycolatopsis jejuensis TaxID=330084 RepID=UPI000A024405|nr:nitroreductase family protein [Amycolatopsis jejuensis]
MSRLNVEATDYVLATTRSVRRRLDLERPVEREVILDCLRLAVQAPTASNRQMWRWLVVDDPEVRKGVAELYARDTVPRIERRRERVDDAQTQRVFDSALRLTEILARVPVLIVPWVEELPDGPRSTPPAAFYGSIFPAIWSLQLALRARAMGSTLTTPFGGKREPQYRALLGLPDNGTPIALLPVAYTLGEDFKPARRPPIEDITRWNRWTD